MRKKRCPPDKIKEPGSAPWCFDTDFVGGNPPGGETIHGTLKVACRAGVPGSELQVVTHDCAWAED